MIDVVWYQQNFGNWDMGLLHGIFNNNPIIFIQHNTKENPKLERSIVIVAGKPEVAPLRQYLETLKSGLVILVSEEDAYFDWKSAIPHHLEVWTSYYSPSTKSEIETRLLLGSPTRIKDYKINLTKEKKYLWSFVGQQQNPFRTQCVEVLKTMDDGFLFVTDMFGGYGEKKIEYQEYLDICCQSKYIACPSGSLCVDSFRLYEAIECGAIPITDIRSPRDVSDFNYWDSVYPNHNILTVTNWNELPELLKELENGHLEDINNWWIVYKKELEEKLIAYAQM